LTFADTIFADTTFSAHFRVNVFLRNRKTRKGGRAETGRVGRKLQLASEWFFRNPVQYRRKLPTRQDPNEKRKIMKNIMKQKIIQQETIKKTRKK